MHVSNSLYGKPPYVTPRHVTSSGLSKNRLMKTLHETNNFLPDLTIFESHRTFISDKLGGVTITN